MHKYQPRVHVIRKDCGDDLSPVKPIPSGEGVKAFSFPETVFTTVTAYQNQQVNLNFLLSIRQAFQSRPEKWETGERKEICCLYHQEALPKPLVILQATFTSSIAAAPRGDSWDFRPYGLDDVYKK